jgi:hypothetical protein
MQIQLHVISVHMKVNVELYTLNVLLNDLKLRLLICYHPPSSNSDPDVLKYI